ncbi:apolipoprotein N-acyltransferase [Kordiimonas sp.]|uniref:apolipoprotein N-acyltransferase n=1 Tax=Kordiimonas sp. TaxID=1970157 RepID=UPI003A8F1ABD
MQDHKRLPETAPSPALASHLAQMMTWLDGKSRFGLPALAFLLGVVFSRAFAPANFFPALFIAIPLMLIMLDRAHNRSQAFGFGWWVGFGFFTIGLNWIGHSFTQQQAVPAILAPFAVTALAAVLALYIGLVFWMTYQLRARGILRVLVFAAAWVLFEMARGTWFTGFPWSLVGTAWAGWLPVAQAGYYIGVYGLSFLTFVAAGTFVYVLDGSTGWRRVVPPVAGVAVFGIMAGMGYMRLAEAQTEYHLGVSLRLVQANVQQREKWLSHLIEDHFAEHMRLSRNGDEDGRARGVRLLIWPETAVQTEKFDREGSIHRWRLSKLLDYGSFAIVGAPRFAVKDGEVEFYNSLFAVNSQADLYARYDKVHLVPFGEYIPFEKTLKKWGINPLTGAQSWTGGRGADTIELPGIPGFSPLICYEVVFPGQVIAPSKRPDWMLNITNDAWFGMTEGPYQHLAQARMRAIEEGLPLVRAASTGVSAVVDPYGRTVTSLGLGKQGLVESPLPQAIDAAPLSSPLRTAIVAILCAFILFARLIFVWRK